MDCFLILVVPFAPSPACNAVSLLLLILQALTAIFLPVSFGILNNQPFYQHELFAFLPASFRSRDQDVYLCNFFFFLTVPFLGSMTSDRYLVPHSHNKYVQPVRTSSDIFLNFFLWENTKFAVFVRIKCFQH